MSQKYNLKKQLNGLLTGIETEKNKANLKL